MSNGRTALREAFRFLQQVPTSKRTPEYVRENEDALLQTVDPNLFISVAETKDGLDVEFTDAHASALVQFGGYGARVALYDDVTEKWVAQG